MYDGSSLRVNSVGPPRPIHGPGNWLSTIIGKLIHEVKRPYMLNGVLRCATISVLF